MAKAKSDPGTALEPTKPTEEQALQEAKTLETLMQFAGVGQENIDPNEVKPPRLAIAQKNSPQVDRTSEKFIDGLREGDMFNTLTGENYGEGPVKFVVISKLPTRFVEFRPLDEGGGVVDFNVPAGDPRTKFRENPENPKKRLKPIATEFREFMILLESGEVLGLSLKSTGLKAADTIVSNIAYPLRLGDKLVAKPPVFARMFELKVVLKRENNYSWAMPSAKVIGVASPEVMWQAAELADFYKAKKVTLDVEQDNTKDGEVVDDENM